MKKIIFLSLIFTTLLASSCSKDETEGVAFIGNETYSLSSAYAFSLLPQSGSNIELCIGNCYYIEDDDLYGDYFYIDLYWDEIITDRLIEGTYTLGGDVLDEVCFTYGDSGKKIDATGGVLTISRKGSNYRINFSGTVSDASKMEFSYSGPVIFIED